MTYANDWVHRFHTGRTSVAAAGIVQVERGKTRLIRALARLLRLPPASTGQAARVRIIRQSDGVSIHETWIRSFGTVDLATHQVRTGDRIIERVGPVELRMRLREAASEVWFLPDGAAFVVLGHISIRLPAPIAPQARAHAWPTGRSAFGVEVSVRVPKLGVLVSYHGRFAEARIVDSAVTPRNRGSSARLAFPGSSK
jgi:hypothetical protein